MVSESRDRTQYTVDKVDELCKHGWEARDIRIVGVDDSAEGVALVFTATLQQEATVGTITGQYTKGISFETTFDELMQHETLIYSFLLHMFKNYSEALTAGDKYRRANASVAMAAHELKEAAQRTLDKLSSNNTNNAHTQSQ